eukprot:s1971_g5.t1
MGQKEDQDHEDPISQDHLTSSSTQKPLDGLRVGGVPPDLAARHLKGLPVGHGGPEGVGLLWGNLTRRGMPMSQCINCHADRELAKPTDTLLKRERK